MAVILDSVFSFEVLIHNVHVIKTNICRLPAIGFRILSYPTQLIHFLDTAQEIKLRTHNITDQEEESLYESISRLYSETGEITFDKGKSCLLKLDPATLYALLQKTPVYVMLLDVWDLERPRVVGSTAVKLDSCVQKLFQNSHILENGDLKQIRSDDLSGGLQEGGGKFKRSGRNSCECAQVGNLPLHDLMGRKVGSIELKIFLGYLGEPYSLHFLGEVKPKEDVVSDKKENEFSHPFEKIVVREECSNETDSIPDLEYYEDHLEKQMDYPIVGVKTLEQDKNASRNNTESSDDGIEVKVKDVSIQKDLDSISDKAIPAYPAKGCDDGAIDLSTSNAFDVDNGAEEVEPKLSKQEKLEFLKVLAEDSLGSSNVKERVSEKHNEGFELIDRLLERLSFLKSTEYAEWILSGKTQNGEKCRKKETSTSKKLKTHKSAPSTKPIVKKATGPKSWLGPVQKPLCPSSIPQEERKRKKESTSEETKTGAVDS